MAIRFPSPWLAAGAGLGGGLGEGFIAGQAAAQRKKEIEQQRQHQAMQLLMGFSKLADTSPEVAASVWKQMTPWMVKQGMPTEMPHFPTTQEKMQKSVEANVQGFQTAKDAIRQQYPGMSEDQVNQFAAGTVGVPWKSQAVPWMTQDEEGNWVPIGGHPWQPRAPQDPYRHGGFFGTPETGYGFYTPDNPPPPGYLPPSKAPGMGRGGKEQQPKPPNAAQRKQIDADIKTWKDPNADPKAKELAKQGLAQWGIQAGEKEQVTKTHPWGESLGRTGTKIRTKVPDVTLPDVIQSHPPQGGGGLNRKDAEQKAKAMGLKQRPDGTWYDPEEE